MPDSSAKDYPMDEEPDGPIEDFDPFDLPPFPPTPEEEARAKAYYLAHKTGHPEKIPANWRADGSITDHTQE